MPPKSNARQRRLVDGIRGMVSEAAAEVFAHLDLTRDPEHTLDEGALRAILIERGVKNPDSALAIERVAGGTRLRDGMWLGVARALIDQRPLWRARDAEPVPFVVRDPGGPWVDEASIDERGVVYSLFSDDDFGYASPAFDTFAQYLEVHALLRESVSWSPFGEHVRWHCVRIDATAGCDLARAVGAEPFAPASGTWCAAWRRDDGLALVEYHVDGFLHHVCVAAPDTDAAAETVRAALALAVDVEWWSAGPPPRNVALPPAKHHLNEQGRGLQVWGSRITFSWEQRIAAAKRLRGSR